MIIYHSLIRLKEIVKARKTDMVVLVTSAVLAKKLGWAIQKIKKLALPKLVIITIPDGEKAKSWENAGKLLDKFLELHLTKKSLVLAMGGGSVSDSVGFVCSIYKRKGLAYINIPTTLLAQVDASIGGKTAVNRKKIKNPAGSFYKPIAMILVSRFLGSLSRGQLIEGLAEIIKAGFVGDSTILYMLESCDTEKLLQRPTLICKLILKAVNVKRRLVAEDFRDNGVRQFLNFGHTIGHAIELKYGLSHGVSVLIGMMRELQIFEQLGIKTTTARTRLGKLFFRFGINLDFNRFAVDVRLILHDKKISGEKIFLPVVENVGKARLVEVKLDKLMVAIKKCN
ncbi:MAG: 3-dehydroquinate synthase [Candidatus Staskawiczbacteria bacterium]|nr:3-dehydroquinate synthase [Candidatus Staskawiczbacteria bacterium]